jgi:hypothetical protein
MAPALATARKDPRFWRATPRPGQACRHAGGPCLMDGGQDQAQGVGEDRESRESESISSFSIPLSVPAVPALSPECPRSFWPHPIGGFASNHAGFGQNRATCPCCPRRNMRRATVVHRRSFLVAAPPAPAMGAAGPRLPAAMTGTAGWASPSAAPLVKGTARRGTPAAAHSGPRLKFRRECNARP